MFLAIYEYQVKPQVADKFELLYGQSGAWVKLFSRSEDYLGTELAITTDHSFRYVTVDRWQSREAYEEFLEDNQQEYNTLDRLGEAFTESEKKVGTFEMRSSFEK